MSIPTTYDTWKATEPESGYEPPVEPTAEDMIRAEIDDKMQIASTAADWIEINRLCRSIGDAEPIVTGEDFVGEWFAHRPDYEPPDCDGVGECGHYGRGKNEAEAIADLLEQEDA